MRDVECGSQVFETWFGWMRKDLAFGGFPRGVCSPHKVSRTALAVLQTRLCDGDFHFLEEERLAFGGCLQVA